MDDRGRVEAIRRFESSCLAHFGVFRRRESLEPYSLAECCVLRALARTGAPAAGDIAESLGLDPGYLSRILHSFGKRGLVRRKRDKEDRRRNVLELSSKGKRELTKLNNRTRKEDAAPLGRLTPAERDRLVAAMRTVEELMGGAAPSGGAARYDLRAPRTGDFGWVVHRHGALYSEEYGWDERFEAIVAGLIRKFVERFDPARERCWIVEKEGENVGCVFLVKETKTTARLRMLLVEPKARGLGIGTRLVEECVAFAKGAGYKKVVLWTENVLDAARHLYEKAGFRLKEEHPEKRFGENIKSQTWELKLS